VLRIGETGVQVVVGPIADAVADEIRHALRGGGPAVAAPPLEALAARLARALAPGGPRGVEARSTRLIVDLADPAAIDLAALEGKGVRGVARAGPAALHIVIGEEAAALTPLLQARLTAR
jgi:PTS system N-acetylglucosamine-specific IIC component